MNLFREIEGLKGEILTSAIIRLLMLRSQEVRDTIIRLISANSRQGTVAAESKFVCKKEVSTEHEEHGRGRVDLYIELDDAIIAIENKFDAVFQKGQLEKYLEKLNDEQERNHSSRIFLVVLAPKKRKHDEEVRNCLNGDNGDIYVFLPWEDLRDDLLKLENKVDPKTWAILEFFTEYVHDTIAFIPDFKSLLPHYTNRFVHGGTDDQRFLVGRVWRYFPNPGGKLSSGKTWVGYYFLNGLGWYGFLPRSRFKDEIPNNAAFVVGVKKDIEVKIQGRIDSAVFLPVNTDDTSMDKWWCITLDEKWGEPEKWAEVLSPFKQLSDGDV